MEEEYVHAGEQGGEGGVLLSGCETDGRVDGESGGLDRGDYGYAPIVPHCGFGRGKTGRGKTGMGRTEHRVNMAIDPDLLKSWDREAKGIPIGRPAEVNLRNNHVQYIFTW